MIRQWFKDMVACLIFLTSSVLTGAEFHCPECGWRGLIVDHPSENQRRGTYCPQCSDQR